MDLMEIRMMRETKRQRNLREVFKGSVAIAGVTAGLFFVWLAIISEVGGFFMALSVVFGIAIAVASVTFAYLKN